MLLQDREEALAATALESALIGRHPHLDFWQREGAEDAAIARAALQRVGLADFATRSLATLAIRTVPVVARLIVFVLYIYNGRLG